MLPHFPLLRFPLPHFQRPHIVDVVSRTATLRRNSSSDLRQLVSKWRLYATAMSFCLFVCLFVCRQTLISLELWFLSTTNRKSHVDFLKNPFLDAYDDFERQQTSPFGPVMAARAYHVDLTGRYPCFIGVSANDVVLSLCNMFIRPVSRHFCALFDVNRSYCAQSECRSPRMLRC